MAEGAPEQRAGQRRVVSACPAATGAAQRPPTGVGGAGLVRWEVAGKQGAKQMETDGGLGGAGTPPLWSSQRGARKADRRAC